MAASSSSSPASAAPAAAAGAAAAGAGEGEGGGVPALLDFEPQFCRVEERGRVLLVTLNRPRALNALPPPAHAELSAVFDAFEAAPRLFVAVVTGAGRAFCAGFDLKFAAGRAAGSDGASATDSSSAPAPGGPPRLPGAAGKAVPADAEVDCVGVVGGSGFGGLSDRRDRVKPVLAAVNGLAHGGGFEIVLSCDVVLAAEGAAEFALPEPRVGLAAAAGGIVRLPRLVGLHNAMDILLTGRRVGSDEAHRLGIVQRLVPRGESVVEEALSLARRIAEEASPDAIQATVQIARRSLHEELNTVDAIRAQRTYPTVARLHAGPNAREGPTAFSEKRKPNWKDPVPLAKL